MIRQAFSTRSSFLQKISSNRLSNSSLYEKKSTLRCFSTIADTPSTSDDGTSSRYLSEAEAIESLLGNVGPESDKFKGLGSSAPQEIAILSVKELTNRLVSSSEKHLQSPLTNSLSNQVYDAVKTAHKSYPEPELQELVRRQMEIEVEQHNLAVLDHRTQTEALAAMGRSTSGRRAQQQLIEWYPRVASALQDEINLIQTSTSGCDRTRYGPYIMLLPVDKLAMLTLDYVVGELVRFGTSGVPVTQISHSLGGLVETEVNLQKIRQDDSPALSAAKRQLSQSPNNALQLYRKLKKAQNSSISGWDSEVKIKVGAALINLLISSVKRDNGQPVFIFSSDLNYNTRRRLGLLQLNPFVVEELTAAKAHIVFPRYLPMLIPPQPWDNQAYHGAYYFLKAPILKHTSKLQLDAVRGANIPGVREALDYLGMTGWVINTVVLDAIESARVKNLCIGEIPSNDSFDIPDEESFFATNMADIREKTMKETADKTLTETEFNELLHKRMRSAYRTYINRLEKRNAEIHSLRCDMSIKLNIAQRFRNEKKLFFPHNMDFRGRTYPVPPNLSHLGGDISRAMLKFAEAKPLGEDGLFWLKVHLANLWGVNKISFEERAKWVDDQMADVLDSASNPLEGSMWWAQAESPFQALATCWEIAEAIKLDNPAEYMCSLPVHQDGSCNGLQHYAGLGRDLHGGSAVNLVDADIPQDVYTGVLEIVLKHLELDGRGEIPEGASEEQINIIKQNARSAQLVKDIVSRKVIKQTVMTSVYGVTPIGARAQVQARLTEHFEKELGMLSVDMEADIYQASRYVAGVTLQSLHEMFDSAKRIMDWLAAVSLIVAQEQQPMAWITPMGLPVIQPYRRNQSYAVKTVLQSVILTLSSDNLPISSKKQKAAFPPNFVHSLDATHMFLTCLRMKRAGLHFASVHDSYWTHPCDIRKMRHLLRESFVELYSHPILEDLYGNVTMRFPHRTFPDVPARGDLDITSVLRSKYFFH